MRVQGEVGRQRCIIGDDDAAVGDLSEGGSGGGARQRAVLHRDIKSANIALDGEGTAKLIDCGLSVWLWESRQRAELVQCNGTGGVVVAIHM